jgi:hypothetical protein
MPPTAAIDRNSIIAELRTRGRQLGREGMTLLINKAGVSGGDPGSEMPPVNHQAGEFGSFEMSWPLAGGGLPEMIRDYLMQEGIITSTVAATSYTGRTACLQLSSPQQVAAVKALFEEAGFWEHIAMVDINRSRIPNLLENPFASKARK